MKICNVCVQQYQYLEDMYNNTTILLVPSVNDIIKYMAFNNVLYRIYIYSNMQYGSINIQNKILDIQKQSESLKSHIVFELLSAITLTPVTEINLSYGTLVNLSHLFRIEQPQSQSNVSALVLSAEITFYSNFVSITYKYYSAF
jgi:hypothetical protein